MEEVENVYRSLAFFVSLTSGIRVKVEIVRVCDPNWVWPVME